MASFFKNPFKQANINENDLEDPPIQATTNGTTVNVNENGRTTTTSSTNNVSSTMSSIGQSARNMLPESITGASSDENDSCFPSLSYQTRLYGFAACFSLGWILSLFSTMALWSSNIEGFVILYTLGNVVALISTGFLVGPVRQFKNMFKPVRRIATIIFISALIATLVVALVTKNAILTLVFVVIQLCAGIWYSASYIPFARRGIVSCLNQTCGVSL